MSLEDYVVDQPTAKKLEENGFGKEAILCWEKLPNKNEYTLNTALGMGYDDLPTYTLAQVLEELPNEIEATITYPADNDLFQEEKTYTDTYCLWLSKESIEYVDILGDITLLHGSDFKIDDKTNPATAAAKLWLWAKEMGHVK